MEHSLNFVKLIFDFLYILFAVNPFIASFIFASWTNNLSKQRRLSFAHKSIFTASLIVVFVMFVFWRIAGMVDILTIIYRIAGGLTLVYMSVRFITRESKYGQNSLWLFFSSPVVAGPATFIAVYNSITKNNFLMTLILFITVMAITWVTLVITARYSTAKADMSWLDKFGTNKLMRIIVYCPLIILSIQMMINGSSGLYSLSKEWYSNRMTKEGYYFINSNDIHEIRNLEKGQVYADGKKSGLMELVAELGTNIYVKEPDSSNMASPLSNKMIEKGIHILRWFNHKPRDFLG